MSDMQINEALNAISDGHTIWKVAFAKRVCKALNIPFDEKLVKTWRSGDGFYMYTPENEGTQGVDGLTLSIYVAKQFKVDSKAQSFIGSGSQARAYAEQVRLALKAQGRI